MGSLRDALTRPCFLHQFKTFPSYLFFHPSSEHISHRKNAFQIFRIIYSTFSCHIFAEIKVSGGSGEGDGRRGRVWLQPLLPQASAGVGAGVPSGRVGSGGARGHPQSPDQLGTSDLEGGKGKRKSWDGWARLFSSLLVPHLPLNGKPPGSRFRTEPSLPLSAGPEWRGADERDQKVTPSPTALGVAGGAELMGHADIKEGCVRGGGTWRVFPPPHWGAAGKKRSGGATPEP